MPSLFQTADVAIPDVDSERQGNESDAEMERQQKFVTAARKKFEYCAKAWEDVSKETKQQWDFRLGEQWPEEIKARRTGEGRPCQTVNWTDQFILHVCNSQRQNEPEVRFLPVSTGLDEQDAKWRSALYRHIEDYSQADIARDGGFEQSVTGGLGYWRVVSEFSNEELNEQEICIRPIEDCATVFMDPKPKRLKDIRYPQYCFIVEDILWDDYRAEYGDKNDVLMGLESWSMAAINAPSGWITEDTVRLAEYFYIDPDDKMCKWARISAFRILEERDLKIPFIPIIQDKGEEIIYNGKRRCRGLTYNLMEAQVTLNYATSALSETAGMGPKSPYMATPKQIEGFDELWKNLNKANNPYVLYNPDPEAAGPPQRQDISLPIEPMVVWCQQSEERFRMLSGIYAAAQGAPSNEISGKAINARKVEGELATYHFVDNHTRAMEYEAMVVSAMMKNTYDVPRIMQITQPDNQMEVMVIGQAYMDDGSMHPNLQAMHPDDLKGAMKEDGSLKYYDPTRGDYNCVVKVGPSTQTQLQEANEGMGTLAQAAPELVPRWADLYVRNQQWKGKDEIADRLIPPDVAAAQQNGGPEQQVAALSQQLMQVKQAFALSQQELQKLTAEKQGKLVEGHTRSTIAAMDNQTKLQTTAMTTHADLVKQLIEAKTDMSLAAAERQMKNLHHYSNLEHDKFQQAHQNAADHAHQIVEHGHADNAAILAAKLTPKPDEEAWDKSTD